MGGKGVQDGDKGGTETDLRAKCTTQIKMCIGGKKRWKKGNKERKNSSQWKGEVLRDLLLLWLDGLSGDGCQVMTQKARSIAGGCYHMNLLTGPKHNTHLFTHRLNGLTDPLQYLDSQTQWCSRKHKSLTK